MGVDYQARLEGRLPEVRASIERAAERAGRDAADIRIIAVSKGHPLEAVRAAAALGLRELGENRVEELEKKVADFGRERIRWHMVGRLQRRKVPRVLACCDLLHSVATVALARRVAERWLDAGGDEAGFPVLLQVNTSGEDAKGGFSCARAEDELHEVLELPGLRVEGLMTMAPFTQDESILRTTFRRLRELGEAMDSRTGFHAQELSMGMTNDYTIAVEEGSTMVRLGTALFGERPV